MRFICGTFEPHHERERELADFVGTEASITYVSCWNANEAAIPRSPTRPSSCPTSSTTRRSSTPIGSSLGAQGDLQALVAGRAAQGLASCEAGQRKLVITDGVFSMEGDLARLPEIVELAQEHEAIVLVDDSHGTGVMGETGRGVAEHFGCSARSM